MRRLFLILTVACVGPVTALIAWQASIAQVPPQLSPLGAAKAQSAALPIQQVILYSSGVGYFQREGEVDGDSRIDLSFPVTDVNDLLKSLVLQDLNGGRISVVSYDSHEPIDRTLRSFAVDLTNNPTFGQILNQARGEKIEVVMQTSNTTQAGNYSGTIIGMEVQKQPAGKDQFAEVEMLNIMTAEGMRSLPLAQVQRIRFLNPVLETELKRALEVLALSHDTQKKAVSLHFTGEGRRQVRVGYVVENPIWKTSYRLVLKPNGKPMLQGWAVVENTSDDDWTNVTMALVSGRPISYQMDLYAPLYLPRPTVEPELFASLRPPTYGGAMSNPAGGFAGAGGGMGGMGGLSNNIIMGPGNGISNRYQFQGGQMFNINPINQPAQQGGLPPEGNELLQQQLDGTRNTWNGKLTYDEYQRRRLNEKGKNTDANSDFDGKVANGVTPMASGEELGNYFQYVIDQKVSLARQKSALLPIINEPVEGTKVSIFNEGVHAKFPLLGLKFKNTTKNHLMQGPVTVFDGSSYAGDARILDLQPNEERLVSYAVDLGVEVKAEGKSTPEQLTGVKIVKGIVQSTHKLRHTRNYLIANRADSPRTLIIEHPIRPDWKLVTPEQATERSRDVYRFELKVPAGKSTSHEVTEELLRKSALAITNLDDQSVKVFLNSSATTPAVKTALEKAVAMRTKMAQAQRELTDVGQQLKAISEDQTRLRANLKEVPPTAAAYKRYLEKFDKQETEIEQLQAQDRELRKSLELQKKEYDAYLTTLNIE